MKSILKIVFTMLVLTFSGNATIALGGSLMSGEFMFRKQSAKNLIEAEAIVTSQIAAGFILTGQENFLEAKPSTNQSEIHLVIRVRALTEQSIWGDLEYTVDQRSPKVFCIPSPVSKTQGWTYYVLSIQGAGIKQPLVTLKWKRIYAK